MPAISDDIRVLMKVCVQWNPVYGWKDFSLQWVSNQGPLDQRPALNLGANYTDSQLSLPLTQVENYDYGCFSAGA